MSELESQSNDKDNSAVFDDLFMDAHTTALLEEKFSHDAAEFRRLALGKLASLDAIHDDLGWALFETENEESKGCWNTQGPKEVLLSAQIFPPDVDGDNMMFPRLRIFSNEAFRLDDTVHYLTEDVIVDHENDAQYMIDAVERSEALSGRSASTAVLFYVDDENKLRVSNHRPFTPRFTIRVAGEEDKSKLVIPFGIYECLDDKMHALEMGRALLSTVLTIDPVRSNRAA